MSEYDNTNRGVLFKNDKDGNENRPDYTGEINVLGCTMPLAAWIKTSKKGNKFMSLSVQPDTSTSEGQQFEKRLQNQSSQPNQAPAQSSGSGQPSSFDSFEDSSIPF